MSSEGEAPKLVYLATRNPALTRDAFRTRWRGHFKLASGLPRWRNVLRYAQCDVVTGLNSAARLSESFDGVAMIWWKSAQAHKRHFGDTSSQAIMEADEDEVFAERVVNFALLTREVIVREGARDRFKLVTFLKRNPDCDRADFVAFCRNEHAQAVLDTSRRLGALARYVQNHDLATHPRNVGLPYEMVDELSFASAEAATCYCEATRDRMDSLAGGAVSDRLSVLADEHILYDVS